MPGISSGSNGHYACKHCGVKIEFCYVEAMARRKSIKGAEGLVILYTCNCTEGGGAAIEAYYYFNPDAYASLCGHGNFNPVLPYRAAPGRLDDNFTLGPDDEAKIVLLRLGFIRILTVPQFIYECKEARRATGMDEGTG